MAIRYAMVTGEVLDDSGKLDMLFDEIGAIMGCDDSCEERCVFYEVGTGPGCPLNQFRDRIDDVLERSGR